MGLGHSQIKGGPEKKTPCSLGYGTLIQCSHLGLVLAQDENIVSEISFSLYLQYDKDKKRDKLSFFCTTILAMTNIIFIIDSSLKWVSRRMCHWVTIQRGAYLAFEPIYTDFVLQPTKSKSTVSPDKAIGQLWVASFCFLKPKVWQTVKSPQGLSDKLAHGRSLGFPRGGTS